MNKFPVFFLIILFIFLIFFSCGVILDTAKIGGTWELTDVEFYVYNSSLDSTKKYTAVFDNTPDAVHPVSGEFFCEKNKQNFKIELKEFADKNRLYIICTDTSTDETILDNPTWTIDSYQNSLTIKVYANTQAKGFWASGFEIKNSWPLSELNKLELTIRKEDVGNIRVSLIDKELNVSYMTGIFKKPE